MARIMTDKGVAALKARAQRYARPDPELRGHWIRVQPSGAKSYWAVTRNPDGKQVWTRIGAADAMLIAEARETARAILTRVRRGLPAVEPKVESFGAVVENWRKRHVEANGLRSAHEINRLLDAHVLPIWRDREFTSIRRSDVAGLLDEVEDDHGARQADYVLAIVRQIMNWYATRHDDYAPPIVRGMRRTDPKGRKRERILTDDEIRAAWKVAENNGKFGALVRLLLLTMQRREKVVAMRRLDVAIDGTWTIETKEREKGNAMELVLPTAAIEIIRAQPQLGDNPYVLAGRGDGHINGFSKSKRQFDLLMLNELHKVATHRNDKPMMVYVAKVRELLKALATAETETREEFEKELKRIWWTLHDLRRTARSLMSRAGVSSEHAERTMGHRIEGIEAVYDRHEYRDEKADALRKLAALIDTIVHPRSADVLPLTRKRKRRQDGTAASL